MAEKAEFSKRAIYYNSKLFYKQLKSGQDYDKLEKTITILITYFSMFESPKYIRKFQLRCEDGEIFDDIIEFHTLEIPKVPEKFDGSKKCGGRLFLSNAQTPLTLWFTCQAKAWQVNQEWAKFFASTTKEEFKVCAEKNSEIRKAVGVLKELTEDERNIMIAEREEKMRRDRVSEIKFGFNQGEKKGRAEEKIEIAKSMLKNNITIEVVANCTGLAEDTILSIQSELSMG